MKIQTFSVVVGGSACNAKCPYCVSKETKRMHNNEITLRVGFENKGASTRIDITTRLGQTLEALLIQSYQKIFQRDHTKELRKLLGKRNDYTHVILPKDTTPEEDFGRPNSYPLTPWKGMDLNTLKWLTPLLFL